MDDQAGRRLTAAPAPRADGVAYAGSDGDNAFDLQLVRADCSDGMSDRNYAYTATFTYGDSDYRGCADDAAKF